ncbi:hypothetical protein pb186bvf_010001 [Paramecium bursaria]
MDDLKLNNFALENQQQYEKATRDTEINSSLNSDGIKIYSILDGYILFKKVFEITMIQSQNSNSWRYLMWARKRKNDYDHYIKKISQLEVIVLRYDNINNRCLILLKVFVEMTSIKKLGFLLNLILWCSNMKQLLVIQVFIQCVHCYFNDEAFNTKNNYGGYLIKKYRICDSYAWNIYIDQNIFQK